MVSNVTSHNDPFNTTIVLLFRDEPLAHCFPHTFVIWTDESVNPEAVPVMHGQKDFSELLICSCAMLRSSASQAVNKKYLLQNAEPPSDEASALMEVAS